jgi:hypothetical protein
LPDRFPGHGDGRLPPLLRRSGRRDDSGQKLYEGRPNILDHLTNRELQLVINTAAGRRSQYDDSYIRKAAIRYKIPYITTMTAALASVRGIAAFLRKGLLPTTQVAAGVPCGDRTGTRPGPDLSRVDERQFNAWPPCRNGRARRSAR